MKLATTEGETTRSVERLGPPRTCARAGPVLTATTRSAISPSRGRRRPPCLPAFPASPARSTSQILIEELHGSLPRELGGRLVVSRRRVVVETMLRTVVHVERVRLVVGLQRGLVGGNPGIHALIVAGILKHEGSLDLRGVIRARLPAVEGDSRVQLGSEPYRELVDDAATKAEADGSQFAVRFWTRFQPFGGRDEVFRHLRTVDVSECRGTLLIVSWIPSDRGQPVGRERHEVGDAETPRDIFDVRIEAPVLVNDEHRRNLAARVRRSNQISLDGAIAFR